tara:strand:+ start:1228 stop:1560 length:333 start_codon:yes stop_codon:yes gene_type:complete
MDRRREKTKGVFKELVNLQLKPHNKSYEDVVGDPDWYMRYKTSREDEKQFTTDGIALIRKKLNMSKAMAEREMSWFILQWGLTTGSARHDELKKEVEQVLKTDKVGKNKS